MLSRSAVSVSLKFDSSFKYQKGIICPFSHLLSPFLPSALLFITYKFKTIFQAAPDHFRSLLANFVCFHQPVLHRLQSFYRLEHCPRLLLWNCYQSERITHTLFVHKLCLCLHFNHVCGVPSFGVLEGRTNTICVLQSPNTVYFHLQNGICLTATSVIFSFWLYKFFLLFINQLSITQTQ